MRIHALNVARAALHERKKRTTRSPRWPAVEHAFRRAHPKCAACGGTTRLQVHHVQPFHLRPDLELNPDNLIVLCMGSRECHLRIGHGDNFKLANPFVVMDAARALAHPEAFEEVCARAKAIAHAQKLAA